MKARRIRLRVPETERAMESGRLGMGLRKVCLSLLVPQRGGGGRGGSYTRATCPGSQDQQGPIEPGADIRAEVQEQLGGAGRRLDPSVWAHGTGNSDRVGKENEQEHPDLHLSHP